MSVMCPNCGQKTESTDCRWCHYPLAACQSIKTKITGENADQKSGKKRLSWVISIALAVIICAFGFIHFSPDYALYLVRSESMKPAINMGDLIITGPVNGPFNGGLEPDKIITFERGKSLVTHRLVSIDGEQLVTMGDNAEEPDPWTVTTSQVKGIYLLKIPYVGYALNFIRSKIGWLVVIILPAVLLVALIAKEIIKESFREEHSPA